jgi:transglutaminase-like putative cysteine protease
MPILKIAHRTEYIYEQAVHHSIHELRLTPLSLPNQQVISWKMNTPGKTHESVDAFGNTSHVFVMENNYSSMIIDVRGEIQSSPELTFPDKSLAVSPYYLLQQTPLTQSSDDMLSFFQLSSASVWSSQFIQELAKKICDKVVYTPGSTSTKTTAIEAFALSSGVCQDHAHIMIGLCRQLNVPARYVSGYFYATDTTDLASHAWVDICLNPEDGIWTSIDISNACFSDERHIRLAVGRDYSHACPVKGIRSGGGTEELITKITIEKC